MKPKCFPVNRLQGYPISQARTSLCCSESCRTERQQYFIRDRCWQCRREPVEYVISFLREASIPTTVQQRIEPRIAAPHRGNQFSALKDSEWCVCPKKEETVPGYLTRCHGRIREERCSTDWFNLPPVTKQKHIDPSENSRGAVGATFMCASTSDHFRNQGRDLC